MLSKRDDVSQCLHMPKLMKFHSLNICSLFIAFTSMKLCFKVTPKREGAEGTQVSRRAQVKVSVSQS